MAIAMLRVRIFVLGLFLMLGQIAVGGQLEGSVTTDTAELWEGEVVVYSHLEEFEKVVNFGQGYGD